MKCLLLLLLVWHQAKRERGDCFGRGGGGKSGANSVVYRRYNSGGGGSRYFFGTFFSSPFRQCISVLLSDIAGFFYLTSGNSRISGGKWTLAAVFVLSVSFAPTRSFFYEWIFSDRRRWESAGEFFCDGSYLNVSFFSSPLPCNEGTWRQFHSSSLDHSKTKRLLLLLFLAGLFLVW